MKSLLPLAFAGIVLALSSCSDKDPEPTPPAVTPPAETPPVSSTPPPNPPLYSVADLASLPADTGGRHEPHILGSDASPYGYYLYTPSGYKADGPRFPLLIYLHGSGEGGNSGTYPPYLDRLFVHGPPKMIKAKTWNPKYPMVVVSFQTHDGWWDAAKVKQCTEFMMKTYNIDTTRIYMTGMSMGGTGVWDQLGTYGVDSHITAAAPIAGTGDLKTDRIKRASAIPIWAFHGEQDRSLTMDFDVWNNKGINELNPAIKAKLTLYPDGPHDVWTRTFDGSGMGTEDPKWDKFDVAIYTWMCEYQKSSGSH